MESDQLDPEPPRMTRVCPKCGLDQSVHYSRCVCGFLFPAADAKMVSDQHSAEVTQPSESPTSLETGSIPEPLSDLIVRLLAGFRRVAAVRNT